MKDIKILVATHKKYVFPINSAIYSPIMVGVDEGNKNFGYIGDNTGDNISFKHKYYSDLSSIYWGWKNLTNEYVGFCHYRRYFVSLKRKKSEDNRFSKILNENEISKILDHTNVIIPKKRRYFIETIESHYKHSHNGKDLEIAKNVVKEVAPEYYPYFLKVLNCRSAHMFNIFIMRQDKLDSYCNFLFPILFEIEKRIDVSSYNVYETRVCGYIAEFLLDTWIEKNNIKYYEKRISFLEKQNWIKKGFVFLRNKVSKKWRVFNEK
jgi:hypothetical protein